MTRNAKISVAIVAVVVGGALIAIIAGSSSSDGTQSAGASQADREAQVLRPNSHRLSSAPNDRVALVEFLDFECEGCKSLYPYMERLREKYDGRVTIAIRYFPNEGHFNAMNAALAAEAAARQGKLEAMYEKLFDTQYEWGEAQESKRSVFVGYARELGLNMDRFLSDLDDPKTLARVESDLNEGLELGVEGTPSLFLNGEPLAPESFLQMQREIDTALE